MRWRRLAEAFPWRTAALLAGLVGSLWFLWWTWFAQELSPLERYYWPTYFSSTEGAKHAGARSRIDPLFLTAPGRKSEIALAPDVVRGETGDLPLQLSQSALERGWRGIGKGRPIWDDSAAIEDLLRDDFYAGQGFWRITQWNRCSKDVPTYWLGSSLQLSSSGRDWQSNGDGFGQP